MRLCNIFNAHFQGTSFVSIHPLRLDGLSWRMVCFCFSGGAPLRIMRLKRGQGFQKIFRKTSAFTKLRCFPKRDVTRGASDKFLRHWG